MSGFTGTGDAIRFALKRDRLILPIWVAVLVGWITMEVLSYKNLYGTPEQLAALYKTVAGNPAMIAISGPTEGVRTLGGAITWDSLPTISVVSGVFAMFSVVRHTRAEEEDGRTELLLASGSGRLAPLAAALIVTVASLVLASAGYLAVFAIEGFAVGPSALLALSYLGFGVTIAGTTAAVCQVTSKARAARGLVGIVIGAAWLLRAVGDTGNEALTWLSPLGWAEQTRPFWDDRWWPLLLPLAAFTITAGLSGWLLLRRDIGGGLIQPRPGPARAHSLLLHPLGFSFRLQRGTIIAWAAMLFAYGFAVGAIGDSVEELLKTSSAFTEAFASASANLLDSYFASILTVIALLASGFTISAVLRPHSEESRGRAGLLLAAPLGKVRWFLGHLLIAFLATAFIIALVGAGLGIGFAVATGDSGQIGRLTLAGLSQTPAMWLTGSLVVLLYGISSRLMPVAWGLLAAFVLIWTLESFGDLPQWAIDLSPFSHTPLVPAVPYDSTPLFVMGSLSIVISAIGLTFWRRRDLT